MLSGREVEREREREESEREVECTRMRLVKRLKVISLSM